MNPDSSCSSTRLRRICSWTRLRRICSWTRPCRICSWTRLRSVAHQASAALKIFLNVLNAGASSYRRIDAGASSYGRIDAGASSYRVDAGVWGYVVWLGLVLLFSGSLQAEDGLGQRAQHVLRAKCLSCHGADKVEGGLRLDARDLMLAGGDSGPAVVEGPAEQTLLYQRIADSSDPTLRMPPKMPLKSDEIELLRQWLAHGAPWDEDADADARMQSERTSERIGDAWHDRRNPIVQLFGGQRLELWSLKPIETRAVPEIRQSQWAHGELDHFVAVQFEQAQLALPLSADAQTLLRRICFDLTGLPPSPAQVRQLESAPESFNVETLVDQLLSSEEFGMHWARLWLDVARYSDSNGFDWDEFRPQAFRYRDYVIRSLNQDKPYDQFLIEQLAGDELFDGPPRNVEQQDALIATGFLRMGPHDNAAELFNEQDRSRHELLTDLVETTGGAILGLTLSCCRCHDHKYDPISQADYYRIQACFAGVSFADQLPIDLEEEQAKANQHDSQIDKKLAKLNSDLQEILSKIAQRTSAAETQSTETQSTETQPSETQPPDAQPSAELKVEDLKEHADEAEKQRLEELVAAIEQANSEKAQLTHAMLVIDEPQPAATFVLFQGDHKSPRSQVEPGVLSILDPNSLEPVAVARDKSPGRRMTLARWIAARENPLTARVMVNRVWMNLMGQGIVSTPGDFGIAGQSPENQALLDWLAVRFMEDEWSIKRLIRTIMLSATYQQVASSTSPGDHLAYAWRRPRRLTAEQLRDSMLAVSGLLTSKTSGPALWPDLPREVLEANPAFLDDNETKTKGWYPSPRPEQHGRSIFLVQKRNTRVPLLETFDLPENSVSCQRRLSSIVAPQALTLLNSPEMLEYAQAFAARVQAETSTESSPIETAFVLAIQRQPTPSELSACQSLLEQTNLVHVCRVLLNINEFTFVD